MKNLGQIVDPKDLVTKEYVDDSVEDKVEKVTGKQLSTEDYTTEEKTKLSGVAENANNYSHPVTHDIGMITDNSSDNTFNANHTMNGLMYFKNNTVTDISQVYKSGFYGTKNTDTTTPYKGYWFVAVFCKDPTNQIAVQWAMNVGKVGNGELWMRTVRLNAASTGDGNMVGNWQRILNETHSNTMYAQLSHIHDVATSSADGFISAADKAKLDAIEAEAEKNLLEIVKVNGVIQTITNKTIDIAVPTKTSDLTNDSGFLIEHQDISGKVDKSSMQTVITNDDTKVPTSGAVIDYVAEHSPTPTKSSIGLGNVDNTADINKPISTAQQSALDMKVNSSSVETTITNDDTKIPTSGAVVDYVAENAAGEVYGFEIDENGHLIMSADDATGLDDFYIGSNGHLLRSVGDATIDLGRVVGTDGGTVFTPTVSPNGVLSWSNNGGEENPPTIDIVSLVLSYLPNGDEVSY